MPTPAPTPLQILLVEDDVGHAEVITDVLEQQGHRVLAVHAGREALGRLERDRPDLVLGEVARDLAHLPMLISEVGYVIHGMGVASPSLSPSQPCPRAAADYGIPFGFPKISLQTMASRAVVGVSW